MVLKRSCILINPVDCSNSILQAGGIIMAHKKNDSPFKAYVVASQIAFIVLTPLLIFVIGGSWAVDYFSLPGWVELICVFVGIIFMICASVNYLNNLIRMYDDKEKEKKYSHLKHDRKDNDFYDSNAPKKKL